jgi:hypothetical protein
VSAGRDALPCAIDPADPEGRLIHHATAAEMGERHLVAVACPEHDPDRDASR